MPGLDGTGPRGMGPMTGGARGRCNPYGPQNYGGMPYGMPYGGGMPYGYGGAMPNYGGAIYVFEADPILQEPYALSDGDLIVPDKPGLGLDWDEDVVAANLVE